jgi:sensor histidine kinase YesM
VGLCTLKPKKMKFFRSLLSTEKGSLSSTRFVGLVGFLFLVITMLLNSYSHESIKPADTLVDAVSNIVMLALFMNSGTNVAALLKSGPKQEKTDSENS